MTDVRDIEAGTPPTRYARGWHCLGLAEPFRDGKPHAIQAFGTKLVVFADSTGKLNVLDGYCRHMGGDLTQGSVKGDAVACPFHDWRWAGNGRCVDIPYARRVPKLARTRTWPTCEENGQLFMWHDPQNNPPPPDVIIPKIDGLDSGEWSDWTWNSELIDGVNCRELIDNVSDMAHFYYVHFGFPTYFKNVFEGHTATQYLNNRGRPDVYANSAYSDKDNALRSEATYYGPAYMIDWLWHDFKGFELETIMINCHYPVTPDSFMLQWAVALRQPPGLTEEQAAKLARQFAKGLGDGFLQDVHIWKNKARIDNPLLCEEDGPVYQLRRWYEQFYTDVEDVTEEMTGRFEFEVDTTHAVAAWEEEVRENMARKEPVT
ncbi:Rieske 2Fe-2S domain-containing protein [Pseudonocardia eucalypti]|uniref:Rieske-type oxygenase n=1 Tax=Pseudonocardia eucalypti TaxID=648755 RepID=A0ABP9QY96_9PSEU|nr:3-ketosteroid 9alpha-monooxygenase subunit A [Pseudonocardia eucalypti]